MDAMQLIDAISVRGEISRADVRKVFDVMYIIIRDGISADGFVYLPGIGVIVKEDNKIALRPDRFIESAMDDEGSK